MDLSIKVIGQDGNETGEIVNLDKEIWGTTPNDHSVYLCVKSFLASQRQGTHKVKGRSEVRGGGRKPFRQKGTGNARRGSQRSPIIIGGGSIFGPSPRDYRIKVNKKIRKTARISVLISKLKSGEIFIVDDFIFPEIKTKNFIAFIKSVGLIDSKLLFLTNGKNEIMYRSGRNIKKLRVKELKLASVYEMLDNDGLIFQKSAFFSLQELLKKN